eukprot:CAMPEP_0206538280 /NCGR_PEP_ID=MMETSP0325_2-20121206/7774_1 /ASSEMBLY_ACC=CAM_ASM_000347 /TAXON_ID=2866 /ORGANISM="Crypthecodinium cohnii, Strain Seligo" /LENGTH=84 /DNA_ID=CAMNT_0054035699 /DNA_START=283 /DNA_END=535 /DNA_ORIENTATION=+
MKHTLLPVGALNNDRAPILCHNLLSWHYSLDVLLDGWDVVAVLAGIVEEGESTKAWKKPGVRPQPRFIEEGALLVSRLSSDCNL